MPDSPAPFQTLDRAPGGNYTRRDYARRVAWHIVQATLFRIPIPQLYGWRRLLLRCFGATLGHRAGVHFSVRIMHPWLFQLDAWTMIGPRSEIYNLGEVKIGAHTLISQDVYLCAGTHDYHDPTLPLQKLPIRIGAGVWVCAGAFVGPNVTIGDNTVVGARAVVLKSLPENVVAGGNPCRVIKKRD